MRTKVTIVSIVLTIAAVSIGILVLLVLWLGPWRGLGAGVVVAMAVTVTYRLAVQPWQQRWGATDEEVARAMPGDDIVAGGHSTTRAIAIRATPDEVWPWLVQLGYGRAGWYSYDWIDNDGHPSADRIVPGLQHLAVGDQIVMIPGMGPTVRDIDAGRTLLAGDAESGTWCLGLYPDGAGGTRLVSRWRVDWPVTPATALWILLADPGAFIMERRMLKGIKRRAERTTGS